MGERCEEDARQPSDDESSIGSWVGLCALLGATFLAFTNYAALLSVVPMWASHGGAGSLAVGGTTGIMMAATVMTQLGMRWLFKLLSLRAMTILGSILLGAPAPLYALSAEVTAIMLITVIRGIGFALVVTAGATLAADLARSGRLATSASYYGIAAALPNLGALAGGIWLADTWGYTIVFVIAGIASLTGATVAWKLPGPTHGRFQVASMNEVRRITAPIVIFLMVAGSFGAATTFLPLAGPEAGTAALALLAASAALILARLAAGIIGDRHQPGRLLVPSALTAMVGCLFLAQSLDGPTWLFIIGASLLGAGFGACQNDSFVATVQSLGSRRSGTASTLWNLAYDGGLGLGAACFGWVVGQLGYAGAFIAVALGIAALTLPFLRRIHPRIR